MAVLGGKDAVASRPSAAFRNSTLESAIPFCNEAACSLFEGHFANIYNDVLCKIRLCQLHSLLYLGTLPRRIISFCQLQYLLGQ